MLKVTYDHQIFSAQEYGGVSRYICEVATRLSAHELIDVNVLAPLYINNYLKKCASVKVVGKYIPAIPKTRRILRYANVVATAAMLRIKPPDIVHETYYNAIKLARKETATVLTVHDMTHERLGEHFMDDQTCRTKAKAVERADHIICVSECTKNDLVEILHVNPSKITVIYHGYTLGENFVPGSESIVARPYLLYVGLRSGYKNFKRLLHAFAGSKVLKTNFTLICFGGGSFDVEEANEIRHFGLDERNVIHIAGSDEVLINLYAHASAFIYPSLYEGFGIPILEAMSLKCPVICSNVSSLPEIAGSAAKYFNPYDVNDMVNSIESVVTSDECVSTLTSLGTERVNAFSWENCANMTASVYLSLR